MNQTIPIDLSIVVPIGPDETSESISNLKTWLEGFPGSEIILEYGGQLWEARRRGIDKATKPLTLCLDVDSRVPEEYLKEASHLILDGEIDVCAIDYEFPQGHPSFGTSVWRTEKLKQIYDWKMRPDRMIVRIGDREFANISSSFCECRYMWLRVKEEGGKLYVPENYKATHLKEELNVNS